MTTGKCKHGEFDLMKGCPQCIEERLAGKLKTKLETEDQKPSIVKVQYYSETTGELSAREYTYYSVDNLQVGDIVIVPVRDTTSKAKVSAVDVPESEIASFKDKVKVIPTGSKELAERRARGIRPEQDEMEDGLNSEGFTLAKVGEPITITESLLEEPTTTAIAFRPGEDVEVLSYYAEGQKLLDYAEGRYIRAIEDYKVAVDDLSIISRLKKAMESKRKEYIEPLKTQTDAINLTYMTLIEPVLRADKITRDKMLAYDTRVRAERAEQERINNLRMEAAKAEMALTGELTESVNLVEVTPEPAKTARTDLGTSSMTDRWTYEVIDETIIPREYLVIDHAQLSAIAKSHHDRKNIPGIKFVNKPIITMRAR